MRFRIRFTDDADEDWAALSTPVRRRIRARLRELSGDPFPQSSLTLCGYPGRLRVKSDGYRILYRVEPVRESVRIINVLRIRPRATAYAGYERTKT